MFYVYSSPCVVIACFSPSIVATYYLLCIVLHLASLFTLCCSLLCIVFICFSFYIAIDYSSPYVTPCLALLLFNSHVVVVNCSPCVTTVHFAACIVVDRYPPYIIATCFSPCIVIARYSFLALHCYCSLFALQW